MWYLEDISFVGLVRNRDLRDLTHGELIQAFRKAGWTEGSFDGSPHFLSRLVEHGPRRGILTLAEFERLLKRGETFEADFGRLARRVLPDMYAVYEYKTARLITFRFD